MIGLVLFGDLCGSLKACILDCSGCQNRTAEGQNKEFRKFTSKILCQEAASNTISIHYTLREPEEYGIKENGVTFGTFSMDKTALLASGKI